jgi:hypothetical protein
MSFDHINDDNLLTSDHLTNINFAKYKVSLLLYLNKNMYYFLAPQKNESTAQTSIYSPSNDESVFFPRSQLGKSLHAIRIKAIREGMKLLSKDEILKELNRS